MAGLFCQYCDEHFFVLKFYDFFLPDACLMAVRAGRALLKFKKEEIQMSCERDELRDQVYWAMTLLCSALGTS